MAPHQGQEPSRVEARFTTTRLKCFYLKGLYGSSALNLESFKTQAGVL